VAGANSQHPPGAPLPLLVHHLQWQTSCGETIKDNPVENGLDAFRASFNITATSMPHADVQNLALDLLLAPQSLRPSRLLRSSGSGKNHFSDLSRLNSALNSDDFDLDRIKPLLRTARHQFLSASY
jgi:hypothetical protein